jgi:hypothetical protein
MADLKSVTVEYLRELARKHLGRGHSKLKTKEDLLAALAKRVPGLAKLGEASKKAHASDETGEGQVSGSLKAPAAVSAASRTEKPEEPPKQPAPPERRPLPGDDDEKTPVYHPPQPAEVVNFPPKPRPGRSAMDDDESTVPGLMEASAPSVEDPVPAHEAQHAAEPLVEGFFVARMAGEQEAWRHHLTEAQRRQPRESLGSPDYDERLGELPLDYLDDTALLLPRDPHTLFVLWDFSAPARQRAMDGLESPRAVLRVYDGNDALVRVIEVALESRSYYIHGLAPGRPYRVEAHFIGASGRSRRIGHSSNRVFLPQTGPSSDTAVRFLRMPVVTPKAASMEAVAATAPSRTAPVEEREYITWRRVALPGSGGFQDIPERRRERIEPGAEAAPSPEYLNVRRAEGSSEQWAWSAGPAGSSEQWTWSSGPAGSSEQVAWWWSAGPAGSSEQAALTSAGPAGASGQWAPSAGPAGSSDQWAWSAGPAGSSEQWARSAGPAGSSERWVWTYGPAGVDEQGPWWARPSSSGQGR